MKRSVPRPLLRAEERCVSAQISTAALSSVFLCPRPSPAVQREPRSAGSARAAGAGAAAACRASAVRHAVPGPAMPFAATRPLLGAPRSGPPARAAAPLVAAPLPCSAAQPRAGAGGAAPSSAFSQVPAVAVAASPGHGVPAAGEMLCSRRGSCPSPAALQAAALRRRHTCRRACAARTSRAAVLRRIHADWRACAPCGSTAGAGAGRLASAAAADTVAAPRAIICSLSAAPFIGVYPLDAAAASACIAFGSGAASLRNSAAAAPAISAGCADSLAAAFCNPAAASATAFTAATAASRDCATAAGRSSARAWTGAVTWRSRRARGARVTG